MQDFETLTYQLTDGVALIELNRPKAMNAFNRQLRLELLAAVEQANTDTQSRVVVIHGAGRAFCSGADLAETTPEGQTVEQRINQEYKPILMAIYNSPKPYIAAVGGAAAGIGAALALACDLILMSPKGYMFQAFSAIGLIPDGGTSWHLSLSLGPKKAYEIMALGPKLGALECLELGLINRVTEAETLMAETLELCQQLMKRAPLSLHYTKQAMHQASQSSLDAAISIEARLQLMPNQSDDFAEGKRAFLEKRAPVWTGR